ncbi:MAG: hypothetical protein H7A19_01280 [Rhodanobacteraceae bacterium]|nr:hypothetical protein [Rhodanobacteraceae bacterium]
MSSEPLKVFALVGAGGSGKSEVYSKVSARIHKFKVMYTDLDQLKLDNRLVVSKFRYVSSWIEDVLKVAEMRIKVCLSDRCPYDTASFVKPSDQLFEIYREAMNELRARSIEVQTIYVYAPFDIIKERVARRLMSETWRRQYHENDEALLLKTFNFFESRRGFWDHIVDNSGDVISSARKVETILGLP